MVFSSSATVYGNPEKLPIREDFPLGATNPYGRTKLFIEEMLRDLHGADPEWRIACCATSTPSARIPAGASARTRGGSPTTSSPSSPRSPWAGASASPSSASDYPTPDGTGVRDYIHVVDLALGHLKALERLAAAPGLVTCNLGTGQGYSVLEMVRSFERVTGRKIPYEIVDRRPGDIAACWADPALAEKELGWKALRGLDEMCADGWRWQEQNPDGYGESA